MSIKLDILKKDEKLDKVIDKSKSTTEKIQIVEESMHVDKVNEAVAEVTIDKNVEYVDEVLEIPIHKDKITIEHIAVGKVIEQYPVVREEDGVTIIPVVKERLVVTKELFLEEEIHITKNSTEKIQEVKETLRKDIVNIERKEL